jgi:hypothetical protein
MPKPGATVRHTEDGDAVGPRMHAAIRAVAHRGPYASKNKLAIGVGPHGSQDYGYRIVNRCIKKKLLVVDPTHEDAAPSGQGAVRLTDKGARYLNEHTDAELDPEEYLDSRLSRFELERREREGSR